jgi:hypothetical protein
MGIDRTEETLNDREGGVRAFCSDDRFPISDNYGGEIRRQDGCTLQAKISTPIHLGPTPRPPLRKIHPTAQGFRERLRSSGSAVREIISWDGEALNL